MHGGGSPIEFRDLRDDPFLLVRRQLREHRQRQNLLAQLLGDGEISLSVAGVCETGLLMKGERVINPRHDPPPGEIFVQVVATGRPDDVLMVRMPVSPVLGGGCQMFQKAVLREQELVAAPA